MKKLSVLDREWEILLVLGEVGNLSRAADKLSIQQPTLSLALKKVEERLGFKVFIRSKAGLKPTPQGKELLESLKKVKDFAAQSLVSFSNEDGAADKQMKGRIRFGMHKVLAERYLAPLLVTLHRDFPAVDWDFDFSRSPEITRKVLNYECNLGIVVDPHPFPDLVIRNFANDAVDLWTCAQTTKGKVLEELPLLFNPEMMGVERMLARLGFKRFWAVPDYFEIYRILEEVPSVALLPDLIGRANNKFKALDKKTSPVKISLIYRKERFEGASHKELVRSIFNELSKATNSKT
jgi:DNA-binding transcriptional LysR family regulator